MTDPTDAPAYRYWKPDPPMPGKADIDRFWRYVVIGKPDECWPWRTMKRGVFWWRGPNREKYHASSPRLAYRISRNVGIGPREVVAHSCDWRACCNPDHVCAKSQQENSKEMADRGLHPYQKSGLFRYTRKKWSAAGANGPGEANSAHVLTDQMVRQIRREYVRGVTRQVDLAEKFNVGQSTISRVIRGTSWDHVDAA